MRRNGLEPSTSDCVQGHYVEGFGFRVLNESFVWEGGIQGLTRRFLRFALHGVILEHLMQVVVADGTGGQCKRVTDTNLFGTFYEQIRAYYQVTYSCRVWR